MKEKGSLQWKYGFNLLCLCLNKTVGDQILLAAINKIERWDIFIQQVNWHRVHVFVWEKLLPFRDSIPDHVEHELSESSKRITSKALLHTKELARICTVFKAEGVDFLVLKGAPLSQQLYSDVGKRFSRDIDILVKQGDIVMAHELLLRLDFVRTVPAQTLPAWAMHYYDRFYKDFVYRHSVSGIIIEMHWRFTENRHFFPVESIQPFSHSKVIKLGGVEIPVLQDEYNLLYLIVHAAKSYWARLSWLNDIGIFMERSLDWKKFLYICEEYQLSDIVRASTQTAYELLGASYHPDLILVNLRRPLITQWLLIIVKKNLWRAGYPNIIVCRFQCLLFSRNIRYRLNHIKDTMLLSLNDIALLPLPRKLFFLYFPLRPVLWLWRRIIPGSKDHVGFRPKG